LRQLAELEDDVVRVTRGGREGGREGGRGERGFDDNVIRMIREGGREGGREGSVSLT